MCEIFPRAPSPGLALASGFVLRLSAVGSLYLNARVASLYLPRGGIGTVAERKTRRRQFEVGGYGVILHARY